MSSRKQPFIHPFTFFLVSAVESAFGYTAENQILASTTISDTLRTLYWLTAYLDKSGQEHLKNEIESMEKILFKRSPCDQTLFRQLVSTVMVELHTQGYFLAAKFGPETKAVSMKALEELGKK